MWISIGGAVSVCEIGLSLPLGNKTTVTDSIVLMHETIFNHGQLLYYKSTPGGMFWTAYICISQQVLKPHCIANSMLILRRAAGLLLPYDPLQQVTRRFKLVAFYLRSLWGALSSPRSAVTPDTTLCVKRQSRHCSSHITLRASRITSRMI